MSRTALGKSIAKRTPRAAAKREEEEVTCAICLEPISDPAALVRLECTHAFHGQCAVDALCHDPRCPLCRHSAREPAAQPGAFLPGPPVVREDTAQARRAAREERLQVSRTDHPLMDRCFQVLRPHLGPNPFARRPRRLDDGLGPLWRAPPTTDWWARYPAEGFSTVVHALHREGYVAGYDEEHDYYLVNYDAYYDDDDRLVYSPPEWFHSSNLTRIRSHSILGHAHRPIETVRAERERRRRLSPEELCGPSLNRQLEQRVLTAAELRDGAFANAIHEIEMLAEAGTLLASAGMTDRRVMHGLVRQMHGHRLAVDRVDAKREVLSLYRQSTRDAGA